MGRGRHGGRGRCRGTPEARRFHADGARAGVAGAPPGHRARRRGRAGRGDRLGTVPARARRSAPGTARRRPARGQTLPHHRKGRGVRGTAAVPQGTGGPAEGRTHPRGPGPRTRPDRRGPRPRQRLRRRPGPRVPRPRFRLADHAGAAQPPAGRDRADAARLAALRLPDPLRPGGLPAGRGR